MFDFVKELMVLIIPLRVSSTLLEWLVDLHVSISYTTISDQSFIISSSALHAIIYFICYSYAQMHSKGKTVIY